MGHRPNYVTLANNFREYRRTLLKIQIFKRKTPLTMSKQEETAAEMAESTEAGPAKEPPR